MQIISWEKLIDVTCKWQWKKYKFNFIIIFFLISYSRKSIQGYIQLSVKALEQQEEKLKLTIVFQFINFFLLRLIKI